MIKRLLSAAPAVLAMFVLTLTVAGCNDRKEMPLVSGPAELPSATMIKKPFSEPITPALYELPSQALITWRDYAKYHPVLVLYSTQMLINPVPDKRASEINRILRKGTPEEILAQSSFQNSDPAFLSQETVSAAINAGIFSEIVFILANRLPPEKVSLEAFKKSALSAGLLTPAEGNGLTLSGGVISGTIRGVPFRIVHPSRLPKIDRPVILHMDLGFFKEMYVNEIRTPAYDLLYQVADRVREAGFAVIATTLSFSNQEDGISLESRFLIRDLADILRKPTLLDGDAPASWKHRAQTLYFKAMFSEDLARESTFKATQVAPNDPATLYAYALDLFKNGYSNQGFVALDRAVELDKGYGQEYLYLAEQGVSMGQRDKVIELLQKAAKVFPNDPFIRLELSAQLTEAGRVQEARPLIAELRTLEWSKTFHPQIPDALKQLAEIAAIDSIAPSPIPTKGMTPRKPGEGMGGFNHMGMGMPGR